MNKANLFYIILFVISSIPMLASTNRKPSNHQQDDSYQYPKPSAPLPTDFDDVEPSAPPADQFPEEYQGYPDLSKQDNNDIDPRKLSFLTGQQMEEFATLSLDEQRALAICSIEEIKQVLNERLAQKAQNKKTVKNKTELDRDTEEAKRRSAQEYEDEELARAYQNSERENYAPKKTWVEFFTGWWSR